LIAFAIISHPLQIVFPARQGQRFYRPEYWLDLSYFIWQFLFWNGLTLWVMTQLGQLIHTFVSADFRSWVASFLIYVQAVMVLVISDFLI